MRVDQYVTGFAPRDAIGNHTLQVRRALRRAGYESDIWAEVAHPPLDRESRPYLEDTLGGGDRALLYQCSTHSAMAPWLASRADQGERLWLQYHNVTPARYFERWDRPAARAIEGARQELAMLATRTERGLAVSAYNEKDLQAAGFPATAVCPLLVDLAEYHREPDRRLFDRLRRRRDRGGDQWLFVGRFVANKCQHDLIGAFAAYRCLFDPAARLTPVGTGTQPRYRWALERLVHQLGLGRSVDFCSQLGDAQLLAHWAVADVFVCLSEHEGFCVPVLEAMELGVPVVAYAATAVPETLGDAGILVTDKAPATVAEAVAEACQPGHRRQELIERGRQRAAGFTLEQTSARLLEVVSNFTGGCG